MPGHHPDGVPERARTRQLDLLAELGRAVGCRLQFQLRQFRVDDLVRGVRPAVHQLDGDLGRIKSVEVHRGVHPRPVPDQRRAGGEIGVDVPDFDIGPGGPHPLLPCRQFPRRGAVSTPDPDRSLGSGQIQPFRVLPHHPVRAQLRGQRRQAVPNRRQPSGRQVIGVALIETGHQLVLDQVVERRRLQGVPLLGAEAVAGRRDRPAVLAVEVLVPPAIQDG